MAERATPQYCPYCGETDIRPEEERGRWSCATCTRTFALRYRGMGR